MSHGLPQTIAGTGLAVAAGIILGGGFVWYLGGEQTPAGPHYGPQWEPPVRYEELHTTGYHCPAGGVSRQCDTGVDDGRTATNTPVRRGVCAADWDRYPPGTWFLVPDYGPCRVEDRGSRIRGRQVDLYFEDGPAAVQWGRRTVRALVIPTYPEWRTP